MPKVSVVIPTHDRAKFLSAAINSVLNQTFLDFEIIVVDDASADETEQVICSFRDPRIRYLRHERNKGQGASRNAGIRNASGEYVALLDDDDEWLPHKLEKQVPILDQGPATLGLVYAGFSKIEPGTRRLIASVIPRKHGYIFKDMCIDNWIGTCSSVLIRKRCFEKIGLFDERLASGADYDMWIRLSKEFSVEYIAEPLLFYTVHPKSISTNRESQIRGLEALLQKHGSLFALNRKNYSRFYLALGVNYCCQGNITKGRAAFLTGIKLHPLEVRHYYNLCLSLAGPSVFRNLKKFRDEYLNIFDGVQACRKVLFRSGSR